MVNCVDILLATYQGERFLDAQIESILAQTYPHFHLIVRDDASNDHTPKIIQQWAKKHALKITVLPSNRRLGVKGNFTELMMHSTAPYAMFSDQDDIWLPHKIEITLALMKEREHLFGSHVPLAIHTDLKVVDEKTQFALPLSVLAIYEV